MLKKKYRCYSSCLCSYVNALFQMYFLDDLFFNSFISFQIFMFVGLVLSVMWFLFCGFEFCCFGFLVIIFRVFGSSFFILCRLVGLTYLEYVDNIQVFVLFFVLRSNLFLVFRVAGIIVLNGNVSRIMFSFSKNSIFLFKFSLFFIKIFIMSRTFEIERGELR